MLINVTRNLVSDAWVLSLLRSNSVSLFYTLIGFFLFPQFINNFVEMILDFNPFILSVWYSSGLELTDVSILLVQNKTSRFPRSSLILVTTNQRDILTTLPCWSWRNLHYSTGQLLWVAILKTWVYYLWVHRVFLLGVFTRSAVSCIKKSRSLKLQYKYKFLVISLAET